LRSWDGKGKGLVAGHLGEGLVELIRNGLELLLFVHQLINNDVEQHPLSHSLDVLDILERSFHVLLQHLVAFLLSTQFVFKSVHFLLQFLH